MEPHEGNSLQKRQEALIAFDDLEHPHKDVVITLKKGKKSVELNPDKIGKDADEEELKVDLT